MCLNMERMGKVPWVSHTTPRPVQKLLDERAVAELEALQDGAVEEEGVGAFVGHSQSMQTLFVHFALCCSKQSFRKNDDQVTGHIS